MTPEIILMIGVAIIFAAVVVVLLVTYLRNKTISEIRVDVYQLFLKAEHLFKESGAGKQKMKWVVNKARSLLPSWAQNLVTEELLYEIIETWFQGIKDLLDDGKINNSVKRNGGIGSGNQ